MIDRISNYLAQNKALPVFVGIVLVILNYALQFLAHVPVIGFIAGTHLLLHLGIIVALVGILLGDAL
jgi:hypothetical protein